MVLRDSPVRRAILSYRHFITQCPLSGFASKPLPGSERRMTLKNPISITPNPPEQIRQGSVFTWVNSQ